VVIQALQRHINSEWDETRGNQLAVDVTLRDALSKQSQKLMHFAPQAKQTHTATATYASR